MNIVVGVLLVIGLVFFVGGAVGIVRLPDFYTRLHAAGKMDTLASLTMLFALALANLRHFNIDTVIVSLKIIMIMVFIFLANPTATHAIVDAGRRAGLVPWTKGEQER